MERDKSLCHPIHFLQPRELQIPSNKRQLKDGRSVAPTLDWSINRDSWLVRI